MVSGTFENFAGIESKPSVGYKVINTWFWACHAVLLTIFLLYGLSAIFLKYVVLTIFSFYGLMTVHASCYTVRVMQRKIISPESLGFALREERKKKGLNQTELGISLGIDQTTVSKVEQGKPGTRLDTLLRLFSALDLEFVLQPKNLSPSKNNEEDW